MKNRLIAMVLGIAVLLPASAALAQHPVHYPRGRCTPHFHPRFDSHHGPGSVYHDPRWRAQQWWWYPQYYGGFHARHLQNLGYPPGDRGLRGTAW